MKCACCSRLQLPFRVLMSTPLLQGCNTVHMDQFLLYILFLCAFLLFLMFLFLLVYLITIYFVGFFTIAVSQSKILVMDEFIMIHQGLFCFKVFVTQVTAIAIFMLHSHMRYLLLLIFTLKITSIQVH